MKKVLSICFCMLLWLYLPLGCGRYIDEPIIMDETSTASTFPPVMQYDSSALPTVFPTALTVIPSGTSPIETPALTPEPMSFSSSDASPYTNEPTVTVLETTLFSYDKTDKGETVTYENKTIDYTDLSVQIVSFSPGQNSEALKMLISLPESWSAELRNRIIVNTLCFSFEVDGRPVDAFRDKTIDQHDEYTYLISYGSCLLDEYELSSATLSIRPYVTCIHRLGIISRDMSDSVQLSDGDIVTRVIHADPLTLQTTDVIRRGEWSRIMLDHCAVNIALHTERPSAVRPPYLLPVTTEIIDWEDSQTRGVFSDRDGETLYPTTTIRLCDKDFSDAAFILDALHVDEAESYVAFTWHFPSSFTDEECQVFSRDRLRFYACFDDDTEVNDSTIYAGSSPFGGIFESTRTMLPMLHQPYVTNENHTSYSYRELHFCYSGPLSALETWREHKSVTIIPYYWYFTEVNDMALSPDGVRITSLLSFEQTVQSLPALAIRIDITPELLESGF